MMSERTIRQLIEGMPLVFNESAAEGLDAVIQFEVSGEETGRYYLEIKKGHCRFRLGESRSPSLTIKTPSEVWRAISIGETDGQAALMRGQYNAVGDLGLLARMSALFGRPEESKYKIASIPPGPVRLPGMAWLGLAFVPWIFFWITFGLSISRTVALGLPLAISVLLVVYREIYGGSTWMERGTLVFFVLATSLVFTGNAWFQEWGTIVGSLWKGGLWLGSLLRRRMPLSAEYSRWNFVEAMSRNSTFIHANAVITLVWGFQFLVSALFGVLAVLVPALSLPFTVLRFLVIWPAVIFTKRRQKSAPLLRIEDPEGDLRRISIFAAIGLLLTVAVAIGTGTNYVVTK